MRPFAIRARHPHSIETLYRARQVTGLLIIGCVLVAFALARANWHEVFPVGWWHVW